MIISRTPYRMSFFGGGTDYRPYFTEYGGSVISATINKYCYISLRPLPPFFGFKYQIKYSLCEATNEYDEIKHPSARECLRYLSVPNVSMTHDGDLPARSGLGSSSAFTVGLLNALHALRGEYIDAQKLAEEAIHIEQEMIGENVGVQDQIAVAVGGFNRLNFTSEGFEVQPLIVSQARKQQLSGNLMMFFTGLQRTASDIAKDQIQNTKRNLSGLSAIKKLTDEAEMILLGNRSLSAFGELLDEMWNLKKSLSNKITNEHIENIYTRAKQAGAIGGKLMGAGGGGFIFFYVEPDKQESVKKALSDLLYIPFSFESNGSKVIYYDVAETGFQK